MRSSRRWRRLARWAVAAMGAALLTAALLQALPAHSQGADGRERFRFGVGVARQKGSIEHYDVEQLRAGWYVDWGVRLNPPRPEGMEYAQMVRLHQITECWPEQIRDRDACPYVEPYTYTLTNTSYDEILSVAPANPGSLWLIGNEMDRYDWGVRHPTKEGAYMVDPGGQDEMLPETYAVAYHELYHLIKGADPTARLAIGGVIQPTPLRLKYLDRVLAEYQRRYGTMIPVDVWNIHNMILPEQANTYGADVPPGLSETVGRTYGIQDADNIAIFKQHILDFRQWMKEKGEQEKPLIISEYSVLYPTVYGFNYSRVRRYLYATFDFMTTATDPGLGYPADGNRLVQRWVWYSLNDDEFEGYRSEHHLFDPNTKAITTLGVAYGIYPPQRIYLPMAIRAGGD